MRISQNCLTRIPLAKDVASFCEGHGIALESPAHTNFVFIDLVKNKMDDSLLIELGKKYNVKLMGGRIAFHYQLSEESVENVKRAILECYQDALKTHTPKPSVTRRCIILMPSRIH